MMTFYQSRRRDPGSEIRCKNETNGPDTPFCLACEDRHVESHAAGIAHGTIEIWVYMGTEEEYEGE